MKTVAAILFLLILTKGLYAQNNCTVFGQTPSTAFPVCGTDTFHQQSVPTCSNGPVIVPGCDNSLASGGYQAKNPFWYKFTCYQSGTLSFLITPNDPGDDYDWQLYDITGHDPNDVLKNDSLFVAGNWSGTYGLTGARANGSNTTECASDPAANESTFAKSPYLIAGHTYLLLISHFTDSQSGYSLSFKGGTAVITDTTAPHLHSAEAGCDGTAITVVLNKSMQCSSLAPDGSDFVLNTNAAKVISASSVDCKTGFDMDSLTLFLDKPLPNGNYTVTIREGSDSNTLLDNCGTGIPVGESLDFSYYKPAPTPMDHIPSVGCSPKTIYVVFAGRMRCNSIAPDGSDFKISGPQTVTVTGASGVNCVNGLSDSVALALASPVVTGGDYTVTLVTGIDGVTIISECGVETPLNDTLHFQASDTVSAGFTKQISYSCNRATINLHNNGGNGINQWFWIVGNGMTGANQELIYTDTSFQNQQVQLLVSNGVCNDSAGTSFPLDSNYYLRAMFEEPSFVCPNDQVTFLDHSIGAITDWQWNFGNGNTSSLENPLQQQYPVVVRTRDFPVSLVVTNTVGCTDTASQMLQVINNCYISVPTAFTPNGDGMNDYLYPLNAYKARNLDFKVFNRYGQLVFETKNWTHKWDGTFHGVPQPIGSYVWELSYTDIDTGKRVFKKGATLLIR
jgi:gliding motility-associated-like protein